MRAANLIVCVLVLVTMAAPLWAQDTTRFGIGVNLIDIIKSKDYNDTLEEQVYNWINFPVLHASVLMDRFRIDPEISYWRYSYSDNGMDYTKHYNTTILHFGIGGSMYIKKSDKVLTYAGVKLGLDRISSKSEYDYSGSYASDRETKTSRTDFYLGPCVGAEYFMTSDLSLGSEFQFLYTFLGDQKVTEDGHEQNDDNNNDSLTRSRVLIYLRWYF